MLSKLKRVDLYRRVNEDYATQTVQGGILSVLSYLLIIYLFVSEFYCYAYAPYKPKLLVESSVSSRIRVDLNITFHGIPCAYLSHIYADASSHYYTKAFLHKFPIESGKVLWEGSSVSVEPEKKIKCGSCYGAELYEGHCCNTCEEVMEAYTSRNWKAPAAESVEQCKHKATAEEGLRGEGCLVSGEIQTKKIPAQIRFELNIVGKQHLSLRGGNFNGKHTINHLGFSDPEGNALAGPMDGRTVTENYITLYYLKVTPAIKDNIRFYETSDTFLGIPEQTHPIVAISFDIEPITTSYEQEKTFVEFIISICAIIGGWFSITQILSKLIIK